MTGPARTRAVLRAVAVGVLALCAVALAWLLPGAIDSDAVVAWLAVSAAVVVVADGLVAGANLLAPDGRAGALARAALWLGAGLVVVLVLGAAAFTIGGIPADEAAYAALLLLVPAGLTMLLAGQTRQDLA